MNKLLAILLTGALAAAMCATMAGCGGNNSSSSNTGATQVFTKNPVGSTSPSSTGATGTSNGTGTGATAAATDANGNVVSEASENSGSSNTGSSSESSSSSASSGNGSAGNTDDWRGTQAKQYLGIDGEDGVTTEVGDSYEINGITYYRVRVTGSQTLDETTLFVSDGGEVLNLSTFKMLMEEGDGGNDNYDDGDNGEDEYNTVAPYYEED